MKHPRIAGAAAFTGALISAMALSTRPAPLTAAVDQARVLEPVRTRLVGHPRVGQQRLPQGVQFVDPEAVRRTFVHLEAGCSTLTATGMGPVQDVAIEVEGPRVRTRQDVEPGRRETLRLCTAVSSDFLVRLYGRLRGEGEARVDLEVRRSASPSPSPRSGTRG